MIDNPPGREVMRQKAPGTAGAHQIQNGIEDLQTLVFGRSPAMFRHGNQRFEALPLIDAQVTRIRLSLLACVTHGFLLE